MADEAAVTDAERIAQRDAEVIGNLMATPQGRHWMERLLDRCGTRFPIYHHDGDALGMAWRDGKGEIGRYLESQLEEHCPDMFMRMIRERRSRIARAQAALAAHEPQGEPDMRHGTPIEQMADEQARLAAEEAQRAAKAERQKPKKGG